MGGPNIIEGYLAFSRERHAPRRDERRSIVFSFEATPHRRSPTCPERAFDLRHNAVVSAKAIAQRT
jgi:hypothetical protein